MTLREKILKAAAFDLTYAKEVCNEPKFETHRVGAEMIKHIERLSPLIEALAECAYNLNHNVTWLERMSGLQWDNPEYAPNFKAHAERSRESLAKLEALLKEGV